MANTIIMPKLSPTMEEGQISRWLKNEGDVQKANPERVVLVAHSLGCTAIAHWARKFGTRIKGALLVAPSDCEAATYNFDTKGFAPIPLEKLSFRSLVVASVDD